MDESLSEVLMKASADDDVLAVFLFGSYARDEKYKDIDVCLVIYPSEIDQLNDLQKEIEYSEENIDVNLYHNLPLYIQVRILEEGMLKLVKDEDMLYDLVRFTLTNWEDFRPRYEIYLESVLHGPEDSH